MFDDLIDTFSFHNLTVPFTGFFQDFSPHMRFGVPSMAGWSKREIRRMLERENIRMWGDCYYGDSIIFNVAEAQAREAYFVLNREGIPITYPTPQWFVDRGLDISGIGGEWNE